MFEGIIRIFFFFFHIRPGSVGVAAVTAGPGLTNTVTAVKNAQMAESPLLLMGGAAGTLLQVESAAVVLQLCTQSLEMVLRRQQTVFYPDVFV